MTLKLYTVINDNTFSNILDEKLDKTQIDKTQVENIVEKLGIPAGVNIEGFDYNAMVNDLNSTETVEGINSNVAWRILAELNYETINDITPKSLVAHAGLSPRENSCGDKYGKADA